MISREAISVDWEQVANRILNTEDKTYFEGKENGRKKGAS